MNFKAILKDGEASVYLLHGDQPLLIQQAIDALRELVIQGQAEDFNLDRFDVSEHPDAELITQAVRTLPMMAPRRMVLVRHADQLFEMAATSEGVKPYLRCLESLPSTSCLVFCADKAVKKTSKLYKEIDKRGITYLAEAPKERELPRWLIDECKARGRTLKPDAADLLADAVGRDLAMCESKLEALCLFVEAPKPITLADVDTLVAHTRTRTIWEFIDALGERNRVRCLSQVHMLLLQEEQPLRLLAMVVRLFRSLLCGRAARAQGASLEEAAAQAGVPVYKKDLFARQMKAYGGQELIAAMIRLNDVDHELKSSPLPGDLLFESAILDILDGCKA